MPLVPIHKLFAEAGLIQKGTRKRYDLRSHSIRKYFRTQLGLLMTIPTDYIEYIMGYTVDTYHDIQSLGVEKLRNIYASAGLSIRPRTKTSKIELIKEYVRALGVNPESVLKCSFRAEEYISILKDYRTVSWKPRIL